MLRPGLVTQYIGGSRLSPGLRLFSLVRPMDRMIGPDLDRGLARLKTLLESPV